MEAFENSLFLPFSNFSITSVKFGKYGHLVASVFDSCPQGREFNPGRLLGLFD